MEPHTACEFMLSTRKVSRKMQAELPLQSLPSPSPSYMRQIKKENARSCHCQATTDVLFVLIHRNWLLGVLVSEANTKAHSSTEKPLTSLVELTSTQ